MGAMASQITSLTIVYSIVYLGADRRKHQTRHWPLWGEFTGNSPHKWPVTRKMFPFDDVIMGDLGENWPSPNGTALHVYGRMGKLVDCGSRRARGTIIMSLLRQRNNATSFDVLITLLLHHIPAGLVYRDVMTSLHQSDASISFWHDYDVIITWLRW